MRREPWILRPEDVELYEREMYRGQAQCGTTHFHAYATCYWGQRRPAMHGPCLPCSYAEQENATPSNVGLRLRKIPSDGRRLASPDVPTSLRYRNKFPPNEPSKNSPLHSQTAAPAVLCRRRARAPQPLGLAAPDVAQPTATRRAAASPRQAPNSNDVRLAGPSHGNHL